MDSEAVKKQKAEVGREAVDFIKDGMIVGIGAVPQCEPRRSTRKTCASWFKYRRCTHL